MFRRMKERRASRSDLLRNAIVTELKGGLGNQMFQYAAGRVLSLRLGLPLVLNTAWYDLHSEETSRRYALNIFPIKAEPVSYAGRAGTDPSPTLLRKILRRINSHRDPHRPVFVNEPHWHYWEGFENLVGPAHIRGYWQSPRYFESRAATIRADFKFPLLPPGQSEDVAQSISEAACSVAVHVRRGDYVTDPRTSAIHGGCCPPAYYVRSLDYLAAEHGVLDLFIFSDDPEWVRGHFDTRGHRAMVVDTSSHKHAPHHDMHLMSLARHHVVANSSFSWWGAWLGNSSAGIVVAPRTWFNPTGKFAAYITEDVYPPTWVRL